MTRFGIILCGGQSSRMGRPKAWLPFGGELMLQRVVRILQEAVGEIVVVAAPGQNLPPLPSNVAIARDEEPGRGPLQGLAAGLDALGDRQGAAYVSSCDVPLLRSALVDRVFDLLGGHSIAVPRIGGYFHPLAAVYRTDVRFVVQSLLAADRLRPAFLFDAVPTRVIEPHELADIDPQFRSLRNLNTPADYESALAELQHGTHHAGE